MRLWRWLCDKFFSLVKQEKLKAFFVGLLIVLVVASGLPFPLLVKAIVDAVLYVRNTSGLWEICFVFVFLIVLQLCLNFILSIVSSRWSQLIVAKLRKQIYQMKLNSKTNEMNQKMI